MSSTRNLQKMADEFTKEYKKIKFDGDDTIYFQLPNGVIFTPMYLTPFKCYTISYADNLEDAKRDFFQEGDQFDGDLDYETIISQMREELAIEGAIGD